MKKKKKQSIGKKWSRKLHLWFGLGSGLIVFIVALTGCIFVFQDEVQDLVYDWRFVSVEDNSFIEPQILHNEVQKILPEANSTYIRYNTPDRPAQVYATENGTPYYLYFNPYSAKLVYVQNLNTDFFMIIQNLHMYLLLPPEIGKQVVGIATLIFIVMLITGIILWWPKKKKQLKDSLKVKWNARWRRINYDLHRTAGIYCSLIALILAITGLGFSYEWVNDSLYTVGNLGKEYPQDHRTPAVQSGLDKPNPNAMNLAFKQTQTLLPESEMYFVSTPGKDAAILTGAYPDELAYDHQSNFYFHPETGELLESHYYHEKSAGLQLQEMKYGLHTGQYFGLTGKIIAFFISLFVTGLPVSGFLVWWGRRKKKLSSYFPPLARTSH